MTQVSTARHVLGVWLQNDRGWAGFPPGPRFVIGRGAHCDFVINGGRVSREHVYVHWDGDAYVATDSGSTGGTFVNRGNTTKLSTAGIAVTHGLELRVGVDWVRLQSAAVEDWLRSTDERPWLPLMLDLPSGLPLDAVEHAYGRAFAHPSNAWAQLCLRVQPEYATALAGCAATLGEPWAVLAQHTLSAEEADCEHFRQCVRTWLTLSAPAESPEEEAAWRAHAREDRRSMEVALLLSGTVSGPIGERLDFLVKRGP